MWMDCLAFLGHQSVQSAVLAALVAGLAALLPTTHAQGRYALWVLPLLKSVTPGWWVLSMPIFPDPPPPNVAEELPGPLSIMPPWSPLPSNAELGFSGILAWVFAIWLTGLLLLLAWVCLRATQTNRFLLRNRTPLPKELALSSADLAARFGRGRPPSVWVVEGLEQPCVWGLFSPAVFLPGHFTQPECRSWLATVLAHEFEHIRRRDPMVNAAQILIQAVYWFHPLIWWANRQVRREREKCCDQGAIAALGCSPQRYGRDILRTILYAADARDEPLLLQATSATTDIQERIRIMLQTDSPRLQLPPWMQVTALGLAALCLPASFSFAGSAKQVAEEPQPTRDSPAASSLATASSNRPSIWPTTGRLSLPFGPTLDPISGKAVHHRAIDIAAPSGTPVVATAPGKVTFSGERGPRGNTVEIDHGAGIVTRYCHLKDWNTEVGQAILRGQTIGTVGDTGRSTGPHLHYEVMVRGEHVDPMDFIRN